MKSDTGFSSLSHKTWRRSPKPGHLNSKDDKRGTTAKSNKEFLYRSSPRVKKKPLMVSRFYRSFRFTDFITRERLRTQKHRSSRARHLYDLDMQMLQVELRDTLDADDEMEDNPFAHEIDEELQRRDFEESIILQNTGAVQTSHVYYKIVKLFRYINVLNPQGTVIALLSLNLLIKCSPEVVQAIEVSNGIATLLNLVECKITPVVLASMKLLSSLFQMMYMRRVAIAFGAVQVLVDLLLESEDQIKRASSDLLASLALLKEARLSVTKTKGIQHLVCLLELAAPISSRRKKVEKSSVYTCSLSSGTKTQSGPVTVKEKSGLESVLVSVATALWRFSRTAINRRLMQRAGLVPALIRVIQINSPNILVPVLGIIQGCAADMAFRISLRSEGILKPLVENLHNPDLSVKLQSSRALYHCLDDPKSLEIVRSVNGPEALVQILQTQIVAATKLINAGWLETIEEFQSVSNRATRDGNNNAVLQLNIEKVSNPLNEGREGSNSRFHLAGVPAKQTKASDSSSDIDIQSTPDAVADGLFVCQLLHTVLATMTKFITMECDIALLHQLGVTELLTKLMELLARHVLIYRQPSCTISPKLRKLALLEKVCALNVACLARLSSLVMVQKCLVPQVSVIDTLIHLLDHTSTDIIVPTINSISSMVSNGSLRQMMEQRGVFRVLFSLCFHSNSQVCQAALVALKAFLSNAPSRTVLLRPVSGSLCLLVQRLSTEYSKLSESDLEVDSDAEQIVAAICSLLAEIASDEEGQEILTELGVVPYLINLISIARGNALRTGVSAAVVQFASTDAMLKAFRGKEYLRPFVRFITDGDYEVRMNVIKTLEILSDDSRVCMAIRASDIMSTLMHLLSNSPEELQIAASRVIGKATKIRMATTRSKVHQ
ncbi:unnamed protein product [Dicrocoelium dendriticum]|nr:unnamed protein product [Dicrocoelium dendriticum]